MNLGLKTRSLCATALLAGIFTVFSWRLVQIQVAQHDHWSALAAKKNVTKVPVYARRGTIVTADGEPLAINEPVRQVVADGAVIKDYEAVADILQPLLEMKREDLIVRLHHKVRPEPKSPLVPNRHIVLKKNVPESVAAQIAEAMEAIRPRCIYSEQDFRRLYPNAQMLSHVVGFVNSENQGVAGIEQSLNDTLAGHDGYRFMERDRTGKELVLYRGQEREPHHGRNVRLTIDIGLQKIVETELDAAMKQFNPKFAVAIIQRPQTGEILAMCSRPTFDCNSAIKEDAREAKSKTYINPLINRAIAASFEPGSTFKIVATGASLNERLSTAETSIFCENGYYQRYKLSDHAPYGDLTVPMILIKSSNIGVCKLGVQLGEQRFYEYVCKFGFGDYTGIRLPGEEKGLLAPPHRWTWQTISRMPMGHEIAVTPLQSVCSMSVIANGGKLMVPQIVREVTDDDGHIVETMQPTVVRTLLSKEAVSVVQNALSSVVSKDGTARLAAVKGFKVAGKTGTAQVYNSDGSVNHERHRVSFVGYLPADAPEFTCIVMLEQPVTAPKLDMGGLVAAPIFARIAERTARHLGLQPEPEPVLPAHLLSDTKLRH